jgi:Transposase DDE domain
LLTDASGFPLTVQAFEGNKAETATMLPVINAFKVAHQLSDVTVIADAGMISEANQVALQAAGLSFILGTRIPQPPDVVCEWRDKHPDEAVADGLVPTQPWPSTSVEKARGIPDRVRVSRPLCDHELPELLIVELSLGRPTDRLAGHHRPRVAGGWSEPACCKVDAQQSTRKPFQQVMNPSYLHDLKPKSSRKRDAVPARIFAHVPAPLAGVPIIDFVLRKAGFAPQHCDPLAQVHMIGNGDVEVPAFAHTFEKVVQQISW